MTTESRTEPTSPGRVPSPQDTDDHDLPARAPHSRLMVMLLTAFAAWSVVMQIALVRSWMPPIGLIQALIFGLAAIAASRWRRPGLIGATIVSCLALLVNMPSVIRDLTHPEAVGEFVWTLVALAILIAAIITGTRAQRRPNRTRTN